MRGGLELKIDRGKDTRGLTTLVRPARLAVVAGRAPNDGPGTADGGIILAGHSVGSQSHSSGHESTGAR